MKSKDNRGTEEQFDRPGEKPSLEQQQLEAIYDGFKEKLETFFLECKKQIQESARARREAEGTIRDQESTIEGLKHKISAWTLLDSLGCCLARLYRTVAAVPDDVCAKKDLISCIQQLNGEFKNIGIYPIYEPSQGAYPDRDRYEPFVCQTEDESRAGTVELDKMGFEIKGEQIIKARYIEFVKDKNFIQNDVLPKQTTTSAGQFSFHHNIDFCYIQGRGRSYITITSRDMMNVFDDLYDWKGEYSIRLDKDYKLKAPKRKRDNAFIPYEQLTRYNRFRLTEENDILYLYLFKIKTTFGGNELGPREIRPLASIR